MNRKEQLNIIKNSLLWMEPSIEHFLMAFNAHYEILDSMLVNCSIRAQKIGFPRVDGIYVTLHIYMIYTQLCITLECLLKSILAENNIAKADIIKMSHDLNKLFESISGLDDAKSKAIYQMLSEEIATIDYLSKNRILINARYINLFHGEDKFESSESESAYKETEAKSKDGEFKPFSTVENLILTIDKIYDMYYKYNNWINICYNMP